MTMLPLSGDGDCPRPSLYAKHEFFFTETTSEHIMKIYFRQSHIDENINTKTALLQELRTGHALMMQCAAAAERLLGYDRPPESPAPHPRAPEEAARMAALFARLGEGYGRVALWRARLPAAALAAAVPNPGEAKLA